MGWASRLLFAVFILFWTAIVGAFDVLVGADIVRQIRAGGYAATTGAITSANVISEESGKGGPVHRPELRYSYVVDGRTYQGARYRYNDGASSDSKWARKAVADFPAGTTAVVRYDPRDPSKAVLDATVNGSDLFLPLFLLSFNLIMVGMWATVATWGRRTFAPSERDAAGGLRFVGDANGRTHLRLDEASPVGYGLTAAGFAGFAATFIALFTAGGFHPDLRLVIALWLIVIGVGVYVGVWQARRQRKGEDDLIIDPLARRVDLPPRGARKQRKTVATSDIAGVSVEEEQRRGVRGGRSTMHVVKLRLRDGSRHALYEWPFKNRAETLAAWLRQKLGVSGA